MAMKKTLEALQRGVAAAVDSLGKPGRFSAGGKPLVCSHCACDTFHWHGSGAAGTQYKALEVQGYALRCATCSRLEFFGERPQEI